MGLAKRRLVRELQHLLEVNGRPDMATISALRKGFGSFVDLDDLAKHVDAGEEVIREQARMALSHDSYTAELQRPDRSLTTEQDAHATLVVDAVRARAGKVFFLDGKAGRGKTVLTRVLAARCRLEKRIVLIVASTGVAALDHDRGMTAHTTFQLPNSSKLPSFSSGMNWQCNIVFTSKQLTGCFDVWGCGGSAVQVPFHHHGRHHRRRHRHHRHRHHPSGWL
eukprot:gene17773-biopygen38704